MEAKLTLKFEQTNIEPAFKCLAIFDGNRYLHFNVEDIEVVKRYDDDAFSGCVTHATGRGEDVLHLRLEFDEERSSIDIDHMDTILNDDIVPVLYCNIGRFISNATLTIGYSGTEIDVPITVDTFGGSGAHSDWVDLMHVEENDENKDDVFIKPLGLNKLSLGK